LDSIQTAKEDAWPDLQRWMAWAFDDQRSRPATEESIRRTMDYHRGRGPVENQTPSRRPCHSKVSPTGSFHQVKVRLADPIDHLLKSILLGPVLHRL
jgi:hypothetical protein